MCLHVFALIVILCFQNKWFCHNILPTQMLIQSFSPSCAHYDMKLHIPLPAKSLTLSRSPCFCRKINELRFRVVGCPVSTNCTEIALAQALARVLSVRCLLPSFYFQCATLCGEYVHAASAKGQLACTFVFGASLSAFFMADCQMPMVNM